MVCYTLFSGSSGNCVYIKKNGTEILIDAGQSMSRIEKELGTIGTALGNISALYITHDHSDHTKGAGMISKTFGIPVFCLEKVAEAMYFSALKYEKKDEAAALAKNIRTVLPDDTYETGDIGITPFKTPHDSADSAGFVIDDGELGIATDLGHVSKTVENCLSVCKNVIIESNYDKEMLIKGPYAPYLKERVASPVGHLDNADAASFICRLMKRKCEKAVLFHISKDNNTPETALSCTEDAIRLAGGRPGEDIAVLAAKRGEATRVL